MKCPVCRATYRSSGSASSHSTGFSHSLNCHRCGVDLSPLIHVHDRAIKYHRQAIQSLQDRDYSAAISWNNQALALYNHADFYALAGQLCALQGEFQKAIGAWEKAVQLNPQHPTASIYLEQLETIRSAAPRSSNTSTSS
jgi:tetratricopeptide (TPR) repeat protein